MVTPDLPQPLEHMGSSAVSERWPGSCPVAPHHSACLRDWPCRGAWDWTHWEPQRLGLAALGTWGLDVLGAWGLDALGAGHWWRWEAKSPGGREPWRPGALEANAAAVACSYTHLPWGPGRPGSQQAATAVAELVQPTLCIRKEAKFITAHYGVQQMS